MYEYGDIKDIEDAKEGDVVEAKGNDNNVTKGRLYVLIEDSKNGSKYHYTDDTGEPSDGFNPSLEFWKLVKTKHGSEAKVGDKVIVVSDSSSSSYSKDTKIGSIGKIDSFEGAGVRDQSKSGSWYIDDIRVLCKAEDKPNKPNYPDNLADSIAYFRAIAEVSEMTNKQQNKGQEMCNIKIEVDGKKIELDKAEKKCIIKTDLEARTKIQGIIFNRGGFQESSIQAKTMKKINKLISSFLSQPENIGKTVVISQDIQTVTTDIPLVTTKV